MTSLYLRHPSWYRTPSGAMRGVVFEGQTRLSPSDAITKGLAALESNCFAKVVGAWNGFFALAVVADNKVGLSVDRARSIPIYYAVEGGSVLVSDSASWLHQEIAMPALSAARAAELLLSGYVLNDRTLCPAIRQVRPGECVVLSPAEPGLRSWTCEHVRVLPFVPRGDDTYSYEESLERYAVILQTCFERAVEYAGDRQIVVPLSGGYDSRLALLMLRKLRPRNLHAYTYGADPAEVGPSQFVANACDVPWHRCDYRVQTWRRARESGLWFDYLDGASDLTAVAHPQDWLAVQELMRARLVDDNAVVVPGYAADLPAGSFFTFLGQDGLRALGDTRGFSSFLWQNRFWQWPGNTLDEEILQDVRQSLETSLDELRDLGTWSQAFDAWMFAEQVPKYTVNALRVVDRYGLDWWIPFFDREFISFWERVPNQYRLGERLHRDLTDRLFTEITGQKPPPRPHKAKYGAVKASPLEPARASAEKALRALWEAPFMRPLCGVLRRLRAVRTYGADPMGWYGLVDRRDFLHISSRGGGGIVGMLAAQYVRRLVHKHGLRFADRESLDRMLACK